MPSASGCYNDCWTVPGVAISASGGATVSGNTITYLSKTGSYPYGIQVSGGDAEVTNTYAELTRAAEAPVIDTSCTALLMLARAVHRRGFAVLP